MLNEIFLILYAVVTFVFGVSATLSFLGFTLNKKNIRVLLVFTTIVALEIAYVYTHYNKHAVVALYPVLVHIPLLFLCVFYFKYKPLPSLVAITMSYLFCQISNWLAMISLLFSAPEWVNMALHVVLCTLCGIIIIRYASGHICHLMSASDFSIGFLCIIPFFYYIFDYVLTVYFPILYTSSTILIEGLLFFMSCSFLYFCLIFSYQHEKKIEADTKAQLLEMKHTQSERDIEAMKRSEAQLNMLRHDMRHFISELSMMLNNGSVDKAKDYLRTLSCDLDATVSRIYCTNPTVNMILSSFDTRFKEKKVLFKYKLFIPSVLKINDVDLTSILSNALENSLNAVSELPEDLRTIVLTMRLNNDKLLIDITNSCLGIVEMVNGIPQTPVIGHGMGTKSIFYTAEKLGGQCQFTSTHDSFSLKVII